MKTVPKKVWEWSCLLNQNDMSLYVHIWRCCSSVFPLGQLFMHGLGHQDNSALHQQILTIIRRSIFWIFFYFYVHVLQFDWVWLSHILLRKYCVRCATRMTWMKPPLVPLVCLNFPHLRASFSLFWKEAKERPPPPQR